MASKQFNSVDGYSIGNATVVVDANANVTAAALTANGNVSFTGANVSLGAVGNLKITGGSSGLYLQTDGSGNLSWQAVSVSTASISNGNSNVNIPAANGNIQVSVSGTANVITFSSNNAYRGAYGLTGFVYQANTAPASPQPGDQWYNTFNGVLFEYLDDGTSAQWVDISTIPLPNIATVNASAVLNNVQTSGTYYPAFISSTANGNYSLNSNTAFSANIANGALIATTFVGALSGNATTAGTVVTAAQPNITSVGTLTGLGVNGNITAANITANTGIFTGNGSGLTNLTGANVTGTVANATYALDAGNATNATSATSATTAGTVTTNAQPNITSVGTLTSLGVNGTVTAVAFTANTGVFTGNGSGLSAIAGANVTGAVSFATTANAVAGANVSGAVSFATTANAVAGANVSGTVSAATTAGTVTTAAQPNITSVGTLTSLTATGNVAGGNLTTGGVVAATGNVSGGNLTTAGVLTVTGTGVSSIAGNLDMTSNTIINLATPTNPTDAATKQYVDDIAQGLHTHDSCNAATNTTLATISGGTVTYNNGASGVGANLTTTGSFTTIDGVTLSNGMRILVKNEANSAHNGIYDRTSTTVLTRSSDFDTPAEMAGGDFTFVTAGTLYDNTGWVMTDAVTTVGTSPVDWVQFSGAGTYTAGTGLTLTGSVFSVNASQTQITSVGTLTGLNSSGTVTAPAFTANTGIFTGNGSGLSAIAGANVTGTVANATFATSAGSATTAGTVTTAAQPNITSTGTLTSLNVSGNTFLATSSGNVGIGTASPGAILDVRPAANNIFQIESASHSTLTGLAAAAAFSRGNDGSTDIAAVFGWNNGGLAIAGREGLAFATGGTSTYSATVERMRVTSAGGLAVGTTTDPGVGNIGLAAGKYLQFSSSAYMTPEDNVAGARIVTPGAFNLATGGTAVRMSVASDGTTTLNVGGVSSTHQFNYNESGGEIQLIDSTGAGPILIDNVSGLARVYKVGTGAMSIGTTGANYLQFVTNGSERMRLDSGGNVGVGVSNPGAYGYRFGVGDPSDAFTNRIGMLTRYATCTLVADGDTAANGAQLDVSWASGGQGPLRFSFTGTERMRLDSAGNLGVGTSSPGGTYGRLTVAGGIRTTDDSSSKLDLGRFSSGAPHSYIKLGTNSNSLRISNAGDTVDLVALTNSGDLGIGDTSPKTRLQITARALLNAPVLGNATNAPFYFTNTDSAYGLVGGVNGSTGHVWLQAQRTDASATAYNLTLNQAGGNVGIGNAAPTHTLSVTGTAAISTSLQVANITTGANTTAGSITGNWSLTAGSRLTATYADLAEKYVADDTYEPGTVLMFGGEQEVTLATTFDSTKVAGVVTTNPAYSMNSELEAEYVAEIALQGRVPCKVIGPVEKGDLMVSAINGHAIANNEARAGTIIGKALENFTGELGIIEVAVGRF